LDESGSSSEDGLGIPISYKYEVGLDAKFKSFNDRDSPICFDAFKKYIQPPTIGSNGEDDNAYVLVDEIDKVKLVNLKN